MILDLLHYLYVIIAFVLKVVFWPITLLVWLLKPSSEVHEADPEEARRFFEGE